MYIEYCLSNESNSEDFVVSQRVLQPAQQHLTRRYTGDLCSLVRGVEGVVIGENDLFTDTYVALCAEDWTVRWLAQRRYTSLL
jgi:hypothetical protein